MDVLWADEAVSGCKILILRLDASVLRAPLVAVGTEAVAFIGRKT
jgi:hypothetical protein